MIFSPLEQRNEKFGKHSVGTSSNANDSDEDANLSSSEQSHDSNDDLGEMEHESGVDGENEGDEDEGNAGWADAFTKVLQQEKPKNKKYLVLSKAKKLSEQVDKSDTDKKQFTFEISDASGKAEKNNEIKPAQATNDEDIKPTTDELELAIIARKERNNKLQQLRVKPDSMDRERERSFKRIATKGVVQLFNAVRAQQRDLVDQLEKAGPLDHKRDAVLNNINKRQFLDMLMGGKRAKSENIDNMVKDEKDTEDDNGSKPSQWSVLRDDFMTNKKLKHWDEMDDEIGDQHADSNNDHTASASDSD